MQIAEILLPAAVRSLAQVASKKRLFHEIADLAAAAYGVDAAKALDSLQERESLGTTGVGQGVALPHAQLHGLEGVAGVFLRLEKPLDFDAERWAARPRTHVDCTAPALATIEPSRRLVREQPGWELVELATGHDPMVSAPDELAALLLEVAGR